MNVADTLNERSGPSELETRADSAKQGVASSNFVKNGAISVVENGHANGLNQPARRRSLRSQDLDLSEEDDDGEAPLYFSTREGKKPMGKVLEIMKERADFRNPFAEGRQALGGLQMLSGGASETGGSKVGANGSSQTGVVVVGSEDSSRSLNGQNLNLAGRLAESLSKRSQRGKESRLRGEKAAGVNFINDLRVSDSEEDEPPPLIRRRRAVSTVEEKKVQERRADSKPERDGWRARKGAEGQVNCSSADPEASGSAGNVGGEGGLSHSALGAEESQHATGGVGTDTQTSEAGGRWGEEEGVKKGTEQERTGGLTAVRKGTISKSETGGEGSSQSLRHEEAAASVAERSGKNEVRGVEGGVRKQASVLDEKTSGLEVLMTEAGRERRDGNDGKLLPGAKVGDVRSGAGNVGALRRQGVEGPPRTGAESGGPERSEVRGGGGVVPEEKIPGGATFKPVAEEGTRGRADESGGWRTRKVSPSQDSVHFEGGVNARHSSNPAGAVGTREGPAALRNGPIEPGPSNLKPGENVSEEESKGPGDRKRLDKSKGPDAPSLGGASSVPETVAPWSRQLSSRLPRQSLSGEPSTVLSEDSWRDARASGTHAESEVRSNPGLERFKEDRSLQVPFLGPQGDFKRTERGLVGELFEGGEGAGNVQEESNGQRRRRPVILDDSEEIAKPGVERMGNSNGLEVGRNGLGMGEVSLRRRQRPNLSLDSSLSDEEEPTPLVRRRNRFGGASRTEPICQNNGGGPQSDGSIKLGVSRSNHVPAAAEGARSRQAPAGPELVHIPESPEDENGPLSPTKRRRSARHRRGVLGGGTASLQNSEPAGLTGVGHAERRGQWDSAQLRKGAGDGASGTASEKRDGSTEFASQERVAVGRGDGLEEDAGAVEGQQTRRFPLGGLGELESVAGERRAETSDSERASQALPGGNRGALGLTAANEVGTEALNLAEEGENFSRPSFWTRRRQGTEAAQRSRGVRGAFVRPRGRTSEGGLGFGDLESEEQRRGGFSQVGALDSEGSIERRGVTVAGRDAGLPGVSALRGLRLAGARQEQTGGLLPGLASASVVENEERGAAVANPGPLQIDDLESGRLAAGSGGLTQNKKQAAETLSDRALAGAGRFDRRNGLARIGLSQEPGLSGPSGAGRFGNAVGASGDSARIEVGGSSEGGAGDRNNGLELRSGGVGVSSELDEDEDVPIAAQRSRRAKRRRSETRPAPPEIVDLDGSDEEEVLGHRSRVRRRGPAGRGLEVPGEGLGRASAREALGVPEEGPGFLGGRVRARGRSLGGRGGISEDPGTHLGLGERLEVPQEGLGVRPRPRGPEVRGGEPGGSLEVPGSRDEDARRRAQLEEDERLARELQRREEIEASDTLTRADAEFARRLQLEMEEEASMRAFAPPNDPHFGRFGRPTSPLPWDEPASELDVPGASRSGGLRFPSLNTPGANFTGKGAPTAGGVRGPPAPPRPNPRNRPVPEDAGFQRASDVLGGQAAALEIPPEVEANRRSARTAVPGGRGLQAGGRGGVGAPRGGGRAARGGGGGRARGGGYGVAQGGGVRARYGRGAHNWNAGPGHRLDGPPIPEVSFGPGLSMEDRMELLMAMEEAAHFGGAMGFGGGRGRGGGFGGLGGLGALGLIAGARDFDERDYEMLLRLDEGGPSPSRPRGASAGEINSLPTNKASAADIAAGPCTICLDTPEDGDVIKRLPCMHIFHQKCIDDWLQRQPLCPICKASVRT